MGGRSGGGSRNGRSRAGGASAPRDIGGNTVTISRGTIEINGRSADFSMLNASDVSSDSRETFQTTVVSALQNNSGRTPLRNAQRQASQRADRLERDLENIPRGRFLSREGATQRNARIESAINSNRALADALFNVANIMPRANRPGS